MERSGPDSARTPAKAGAQATPSALGSRLRRRAETQPAGKRLHRGLDPGFRRGTSLLLVLPVLLLTLPSAAPNPRAQFIAARAEASAAARRAQALEAEAARARGQAERARAAARLTAARIGEAESRITAAEAQLGLLTAQRRAVRARLAQRERPSAGLLAALQSLSRRPAVALLAQPGTLDDAIHVRALLASTLPAVQARTAGIRRELDALRRVEAAQGAAFAELRRSRAVLASENARLISLERSAGYRATRATALALDEGDRALARGEDARGFQGQAARARAERDTLRRLSALPSPLPRPGAERAARRPSRPAYLLPVEGRLLTGTGEISPAGVHARGITLAATPGAAVIAPADARVLWAGPFRSWGGVVILDHGGGWTTTLTNLTDLEVRAGQTVARGRAVASARAGGVGAELRRGLQPIPIPLLLRSS